MAEEDPAEESLEMDSEDEDKISPSTYVSPQMSLRSRSTEYHTAATSSQYSDQFHSISSQTYGEDDPSLDDLTNEIHYALDEG